MKRQAKAARRRAANNRGMTLIEVILAVVLVASAAGLFATAISNGTASLDRQKKLLGATELANRLILIQMDNPEDLPTAGSIIDYGGLQYRWRLTERETVQVELSEAGLISTEGDANPIQFQQRVKLINAEVWLSEYSGGSFDRLTAQQTGVARAEISRLNDIFDFDNIDSLNRRGAQNVLLGLVNQLSVPLDGEVEQGGSGSSSSSSSRSRSRSSSSSASASVGDQLQDAASGATESGSTSNIPGIPPGMTEQEYIQQLIAELLARLNG